MSEKDWALQEVETELVHATNKFGPFASTHEGYAVILEELDELWNLVKRNGLPRNMRAEAVQVAAMAIRFMMDICPLAEKGRAGE